METAGREVKIDVSQDLGTSIVQHGYIFKTDHVGRPFPDFLVNRVVLAVAIRDKYQTKY